MSPSRQPVWVPHRDAERLMGGLPSGVALQVWDGTGEPPGGGAEVAFVVPPFLAGAGAVRVLAELPALRVVQTLTAGVDSLVGRLPAGVALCDARGVHSSATSEWVLAVALAVYRRLPSFVRAQDQRQWAYEFTDELADKTALVVGYGSVGAAVEARLRPFGVEVARVARRARAGVAGIDELPALLGQADLVVLVVPLTEATRGLVDADFLSRMRDGALLVNGARGEVVDTDALLAELQAGRLRAALDVTDPEPLPAEHPLWHAPGLLLTPHVGGSVPGFLPRAYRLVRSQLERHLAGQPLANVVTEGY